MQSEQLNELAGALSKVQAEIKAVSRDSSNPFFKSKYAGLEAVLDSLFALLPKNDLCLIQTVQMDERGEHCGLETTLLHSSGQWICGFQPLRPVKDDPQGMGSAITYARRYGAAAICGLAQEDDDGNKAAGQEVKKTEKKVEDKRTPTEIWSEEFGKKGYKPEALTLLLTLKRPGVDPEVTLQDEAVKKGLKALLDGKAGKLSKIYLDYVGKLPPENAENLMKKIEAAEIIFEGAKMNYDFPESLKKLTELYKENC